MITEYPLISCVCITHHRPQLLERAINSFHSQSYPNKELVILYESDDSLTHEFLSRQESDEIKIIKVENAPDIHLGALRNWAIKEASGEYICQWDDDDWYHPARLQYQYKLLQENNYQACVLGHFLIFDSHASNAYLSCYRSWEGSLLCKKELATENPYSNIKRGEDTPLINTLREQNLLFTDRSITPLYHYVYHGNNTWDYNHFSGFFPFSKPLPTQLRATIQTILSEQKVRPENIDQLDTQFKILFDFEK